MDRRDRALLDLVEHAVFVLEMGAVGQPRYVALNRFACNALGCRESDILGLSADQIFPGALGQVVYDFHVNAFETGEMTAYEVLLPFDDGDRLIKTTLVPVRDEGGDVIRVVGSSLDMSGRHVHTTDRGTTDFDEVENFIHLAAHDMRAPLRNIGSIVEMLRDDLEDAGPEALALLDMLGDISDKTGEMIGQILSHAAAMSARVERVSFDLKRLVRDIQAMLDPGGTCDVKVQEGNIFADRNAIQVILTNLIDNTIKHAMPRCGSLSLEITHRAEADGSVSISVSDNGHGFSDPTLLLLDGGQLRSDAGFGIFGQPFVNQSRAIRRAVVKHHVKIQRSR